MTKPIVVELTREAGGWPQGAELGYKDEATAARVLGEGSFKVLKHQDGTLVETKAQKAADDPKTGKKA